MKQETVDFLDTCPLDELNTYVKARAVNEREEKMQEWLEMSKLYEFKGSDLNGTGKPKNKLPAKYCNPDNNNQIWSGKGRPPNWMQEKLDKGMGKEDFLITKE